MVIVNCCGVQICTVIIYIMLHVYFYVKTGMWPEEIESFHAGRTMVALEENVLEPSIARGIYGGPFIIRTVWNIIE